MGKLSENLNSLKDNINSLTEDLLEKSNKFLINYENSLTSLYEDSSILKQRMKDKIERGIKNYGSK